jgi:hydrogenase small subunit
MAEERNDAFYEQLAARGVSRRAFLKYCGSLAVMLGLAESAAPRIAAAIEKAPKLTPALWLAQGLCTGCTESMAQVDSPDVPTIVLDILSINYWETTMAATGASADANIKDTVEKYKGEFIAIVEGSVMKGWDGNALLLNGKPGIEVLKEVLPNAKAILAVGSCAVDGGWVKAEPNPADATGVMQAFPELKAKVINLPTCPVNPEWVVAMIVDVLLLGKVPELDELNRPKLIFGQTIHDNCPRRGHFENNQFVTQFGSEEELKQYCLYQVGCKGPQTKTNCPYVRWNARVSWCVESGSPCIGCGNFNWVDEDAPFLQRMPDVAGINPETVGAVLGGATLAGIVVHGIAQTATGRMGTGAPVEEDTKGGDS